MGHSPYGHPQVSTDGTRAAVSYATRAALKAIDTNADDRISGRTVVVASDFSRWVFHPTSSAVDVTENLVLTPDSGSGRWLRIDKTLALACAAVTFATADAAVVFTVPTGAQLLVRRGHMVNTVAWTGGTSSAIGLSSSNAAFNTKGDLHGGSGGELTAAAGAGLKLGTIGAKTAAGIILVAADTVRFDRIASVYTAGAGVPYLMADVIGNLGA